MDNTVILVWDSIKLVSNSQWTTEETLRKPSRRTQPQHPPPYVSVLTTDPDREECEVKVKDEEDEESPEHKVEIKKQYLDGEEESTEVKEEGAGEHI